MQSAILRIIRRLGYVRRTRVPILNKRYIDFFYDNEYVQQCRAKLHPIRIEISRREGRATSSFVFFTLLNLSIIGFEVKSFKFLKDQFPAAMEELKSQEMRMKSNQMGHLTVDIHCSLRCRLCAMPDNDMTDIFTSNETGKNILDMIDYCLPVVVRIY